VIYKGYHLCVTFGNDLPKAADERLTIMLRFREVQVKISFRLHSILTEDFRGFSNESSQIADYVICNISNEI
jgi:hypothetical protein